MSFRIGRLVSMKTSIPSPSIKEIVIEDSLGTNCEKYSDVVDGFLPKAHSGFKSESLSARLKSTFLARNINGK
ncbi:hypothetical protein Plhal304r1_c024g0083581 [Plasmopara halstedii]